MVKTGILRTFGEALRSWLATRLSNRFAGFAAGMGLAMLLQKLNGRITSRSKSAGRRIGIYGGCSGRRSRRRSGQCLGRTHSDTEHFQSYSHSAHCRNFSLSAANGKARRSVRPDAAGFRLRSSGAAKHHGLDPADARQSDHSGNLGASSGASLPCGGCRHRLCRPIFLQPSRCRSDGGCHCERSAAGISRALGRIGCEFRQCALGCSRNSRRIKSGSESAARKLLLSGRRLWCRREQSFTLFRLRAAFLHLSEIRQTA